MWRGLNCHDAMITAKLGQESGGSAAGNVRNKGSLTDEWHEAVVRSGRRVPAMAL